MALYIKWSEGAIDSNWNPIVTENSIDKNIFIRINNFSPIKLNCSVAEWQQLLIYSKQYTKCVTYEHVRWGGSDFLEGGEDAKTSAIMIRPSHRGENLFFAELEPAKFQEISLMEVFYLVRILGEGCNLYNDDFFTVDKVGTDSQTELAIEEEEQITTADGSDDAWMYGAISDKSTDKTETVTTETGIVTYIPTSTTTSTAQGYTPKKELVTTPPLDVDFVRTQQEFLAVADKYIYNFYNTVEATVQCYDNTYEKTVIKNKAIEDAKSDYEKRQIETEDNIIMARVNALKERRKKLIELADSGIDTSNSLISTQLVTVDTDIENAIATASNEANSFYQTGASGYLEGIESTDGDSDADSDTKNKSIKVNFFNESFIDVPSTFDFDIFTGYLRNVINKWVNVKLNYEYSYDKFSNVKHENMSASSPISIYTYYQVLDDGREIPRETVFAPYNGYAFRMSGTAINGIRWLLNKLNLDCALYDIKFDYSSKTYMHYVKVIVEATQFDSTDTITIYKGKDGKEYVQRNDDDHKNEFMSLDDIKDTYGLNLYEVLKSFGIPYTISDDVVDVNMLGLAEDSWKPSPIPTKVDIKSDAFLNGTK